jgi:hypothetical protein
MNILTQSPYDIHAAKKQGGLGDGIGTPKFCCRICPTYRWAESMQTIFLGNHAYAMITKKLSHINEKPASTFAAGFCSKLQ